MKGLSVSWNWQAWKRSRSHRKTTPRAGGCENSDTCSSRRCGRNAWHPEPVKLFCARRSLTSRALLSLHGFIEVYQRGGSDACRRVEHRFRHCAQGHKTLHGNLANANESQPLRQVATRETSLPSKATHFTACWCLHPTPMTNVSRQVQEHLSSFTGVPDYLYSSKRHSSLWGRNPFNFLAPFLAVLSLISSKGQFI